jgi:hypothetical protein
MGPHSAYFRSQTPSRSHFWQGAFENENLSKIENASIAFGALELELFVRGAESSGDAFDCWWLLETAASLHSVFLLFPSPQNVGLVREHRRSG